LISIRRDNSDSLHSIDKEKLSSKLVWSSAPIHHGLGSCIRCTHSGGSGLFQHRPLRAHWILCRCDLPEMAV